MVHTRTRQRAIVQKYVSFYDPVLRANFRLPMVHLRITQSNNTISTTALLDSGATVSYIPIELAEIVGFQFPGQYKVQISEGAGGKFNSYVVNFDRLDVLKNRDIFQTFRNAEILVPGSHDLIPYAILGRDYIFENFDITFREREKKVVLRS